MTNSLKNINILLNQPNTFQRNLDSIIELSTNFIEIYETKDSSYGDKSKPDELRPLLATISDSSILVPIEIDIILARILKVLLRKSVNRIALGKYGISAMIKSIQRIQNGQNMIAAAEMCNVILNACYDGINVQLLIEQDGISPMIRLLKSNDHMILSSVLGVLQGLCYVPFGRQTIRQDAKLLKKIASFLNDDNSIVRMRSVGVIHNLSVDIISINLIMETNCILALIELLRDSSADICRASAGTIQNLSRDIVAKKCIVDNGAIDYLSDLLFASDIACQVAAVGTILNIVGSSLSADSEERVLLNQILTDSLVLGAIRSSIFDH